AEATLLSRHKKVGDAVERYENLIDVETDTVVLELPEPAGGGITRILKGDGGTVASGEVIAMIDTAADSAAAVARAAERPAAAQAAKQVSEQSKLMPAARKMVEDKQLDPKAIAGSGRDGRVTKADVIARLEGGAAARPAPSAPARAPAAARPALPQVPAPINADKLLAGRPEQRVPMSRLRARVAERLLQSQSTAAILTTFNEVNMQPVLDLRAKHKDKFEKEHGVKLGFMSFFVKAAVYALKKYPIVNASVDGNEIVYHGYFDIGVAVGSPRGLVVPVLRDADQMSFARIEKTIADLGKRAAEGKLAMEELSGGTFAISNGGVFGSMLSTPIINPPQSAILGIHATKERAVVESGQIVIRPMNYFALSYDHRIIDGREAVLSLVAMKDALEDPLRLLLDL
ncbi:MAG: 2-oxoglutarate dehydrogenase complex dihydrolipoyllysine-residue succinyltransferase, partial [Betaproteobacteria bacterium]|nr:2-oxoglutarate dehydrogenase complex dihydrolipoyllysine-residue succinyltransferase [Betaproteobacteria bacterium]